jgi:hypothetical protein
MDGQGFDRFTKRLVLRSSRRRALAAISAVALAPLAARHAPEAAATKRCKKPQETCTRSAQCCGKKSTCGHSHGGGSVKLTCCGKVGAKCPGNALGCCIPLVCGANNRCVEP